MDTVSEDRPHETEGRVFKAYRIRAGITQRILSMETGISIHMIREYEQGRCLPSAERLIMIMVRLSIPAAELSSVRHLVADTAVASLEAS